MEGMMEEMQFIDTNRENQKVVILDALNQGEEVTSMWGFDHGIVRLTNRVNELIVEGYPIRSEWVTPDKGNKYKKYWLCQK